MHCLSKVVLFIKTDMGKTKIEYLIMRNTFDCKSKKVGYKISLKKVHRNFSKTRNDLICTTRDPDSGSTI